MAAFYFMILHINKVNFTAKSTYVLLHNSKSVRKTIVKYNKLQGEKEKKSSLVMIPHSIFFFKVLDTVHVITNDP